MSLHLSTHKLELVNFILFNEINFSFIVVERELSYDELSFYHHVGYVDHVQQKLRETDKEERKSHQMLRYMSKGFSLRLCSII